MAPSARYPAAVLIGLGFFIGVVFSGDFASFVQYSNTMGFCISCHEMQSTVYQEYRKTSHYLNPSGVRAKCSDCHVPHENWLKMVIFKIGRTRELFYHLVGSVDTREKFEAKRLELAKRVWAEMEASDSKACRNCHSLTAMDLAEQRPRARSMHEGALEAGVTCIDCHKEGIAHKPIHEQLEKEKAPEEGGFTLPQG